MNQVEQQILNIINSSKGIIYTLNKLLRYCELIVSENDSVLTKELQMFFYKYDYDDIVDRIIRRQNIINILK